jgi:FtsZ-binding cell division protein ZapB
LSQIIKYDGIGCDTLEEVQECIEQLQKENSQLKQECGEYKERLKCRYFAQEQFARIENIS